MVKTANMGVSNLYIIREYRVYPIFLLTILSTNTILACMATKQYTKVELGEQNRESKTTIVTHD